MFDIPEHKRPLLYVHGLMMLLTYQLQLQRWVVYPKMTTVPACSWTVPALSVCAMYVAEPAGCVEPCKVAAMASTCMRRSSV